MASNKKFAIRLVEKRTGWAAEITRQVTSRKVVVSKRELGFETEAEAQAWAEKELAGFVKNQAERNERKGKQRQEREEREAAAAREAEQRREARLAAEDAEEE
ncbi:DUF3622 domain-containing protein [Vibrio kyushuensis]|uniref:DUF3622 domain-containing protein n=1 Tax=Vibrio kyushuensis TaxID=2910249 RepID=UPI003D09C767